MANNTLFDGDAYWNDSWVQELNGDEERLYHFYITSPHLDKSGVYKETERAVDFYVHGIGLEKIREITEKFARAKKVIRCGEWIIVPSTLKHQKYGNNGNVITSIIDYLKALPDDVFEALRGCNYPIDLNAIRPKPGNPSPAPGEPLPSPSPEHQNPTPTAGENLIEFNSSEFELNINKINGNSISEPNSENQDGCENPVENQPPPTNLLQIIKEKAKTMGFYLDDPIARKIEKAVPNWVWFTNTHDIIGFVSQKVRDIYNQKPKAEQKKLFISALTSWENIRDEYPDWLSQQLHADEVAAIDKLRNTPPTHCISCGTELESRVCPECKGSILWSEENRVWEYQEYFDFSAALEEARKNLGKGPKPDEAPPEEPDIEF